MKRGLWVIMSGMSAKLNKFLIVILAAAAAAACSKGDGGNANANNAVANTKPVATPSNQVTETDVAKLKWLEGTWRGMDGDKPFFERIHFEGSTMIVETFADETVSKVEETGRFELKDGEFGHTKDDRRSAASVISENSVQFVPDSLEPGTPPRGHFFRFEKQDDGTWKAVLETPAAPGRAPTEKVYKMEPWKAPAK